MPVLQRFPRWADAIVGQVEHLEVGHRFEPRDLRELVVLQVELSQALHFARPLIVRGHVFVPRAEKPNGVERGVNLFQGTASTALLWLGEEKKEEVNM